MNSFDVQDERDRCRISRNFREKYVRHTKRQRRGMQFVWTLVDQNREIGSLWSGDAKSEQHAKKVRAYQRNN